MYGELFLRDSAQKLPIPTYWYYVWQGTDIVPGLSEVSTVLKASRKLPARPLLSFKLWITNGAWSLSPPPLLSILRDAFCCCVLVLSKATSIKYTQRLELENGFISPTTDPRSQLSCFFCFTASYMALKSNSPKSWTWDHNRNNSHWFVQTWYSLYRSTIKNGYYLDFQGFIRNVHDSFTSQTTSICVPISFAKDFPCISMYH